MNRTVTVEVLDFNTTSNPPELLNFTSNVAMFNYKRPSIDSTIPRPVRMDIATASYAISLQGSNLGTCDHASKRAARHSPRQSSLFRAVASHLPLV